MGQGAVLNLLLKLIILCGRFMAFIGYPCAPIWELWFNLYFQAVFHAVMVAIITEHGKAVAERVFAHNHRIRRSLLWFFTVSQIWQLLWFAFHLENFHRGGEHTWWRAKCSAQLDSCLFHLFTPHPQFLVIISIFKMAYSAIALSLFYNQYARNFRANVQHDKARTHMRSRYKTFKSCRRSPQAHKKMKHRIVDTVLTNDLLDLYINKALVKYYYMALYQIEGEVDILWDGLVKKMLRELFAKTPVLTEQNLAGSIKDTSDDQVFFMRIFGIRYLPGLQGRKSVPADKETVEDA